jgi:uncharacterized membrane protein
VFRDIVIAWIFAGVISAILNVYWLRDALKGKFGHKTQAEMAGMAAAAHGWPVVIAAFLIFGLAVPFILLPMALYSYTVRKIRERES